MTPRQAATFVRKHGVVLEAATGSVPALAAAIVGAPIRGSWWAHPRRHAIFELTRAIRDSRVILVCRLVDGRITYVHRRLWPALVRAARHFPIRWLARVDEIHTASGNHVTREVAFPAWVPDEISAQASAMSEEQAVLDLSRCIRITRGTQPGSSARKCAASGTLPKAESRKAMPARIDLRPPAVSDQAEFLRLARASHALHGAWVRAPATPAQYAAYLRRMQQPGNRAFLVRLRTTQQIVGVVNLTQVVMGVFCSGYLGYYAFAGHEHQGLMREGLKAVARHAFTALKLHRLEANIQPDNVASIALVRSCGFQREGYSPRYLKIGGRWRDHERWALRSS